MGLSAPARFRQEYNSDRLHQALGMAFPADRFRPSRDDGIPLKLPPTLASAGKM
jgi:hypothetical protein